MKQPDRVAAAADAGDRVVRQPPRRFQDLRPRLAPDHRLEFAHELRIRMRPGRAADQVVRVANVRHPAADRFVHRVLQRPRAALDDLDLRAEQVHAEDVERLPPHILRAHEHRALHPEHRAHRRRRDAVLAGARLGEHAALAHPPCEQPLCDGVVDLVRAGVRQVLSLDVDLRATEPLCQVLGEVERGRRAGGGSVAEPDAP